MARSAPTPQERGYIGIGVLGFGVVGSGVVQVLTQQSQRLQEQAGLPLRLTRILVRDAARSRPVEVPRPLLATNPAEVIQHPATDILIEVMGGEEPARHHIRQALQEGCHVVTANKEVMAKHGPDLLKLARDRGASLFYEAAVGGGIPVIVAFRRGLAANRLTAIRAIINGTTNYILTRMAQDRMDFSTALALAQKLGYAERNATDDVEGIDAAYKLTILATLAFRTSVDYADVYHEGITRLTANDFRYAQELGYAIKLLAIAKEEDGRVQARVHPAFLHEDVLLAKVDGVYNAVQVEGDLVGSVLFSGEGAGALPTSSAVLSDVLEVSRSIVSGKPGGVSPELNNGLLARPIEELESRYYFRVGVVDRAGTLAKITKVLGDLGISIASVIQKETDEIAQVAEIVIMTHKAREAAVRQAEKELATLDVVQEVGNIVRVED